MSTFVFLLNAPPCSDIYLSLPHLSLAPTTMPSCFCTRMTFFAPSLKVHVHEQLLSMEDKIKNFKGYFQILHQRIMTAMILRKIDVTDSCYWQFLSQLLWHLPTRHCKDVRSLVSSKFANCVFSVRRLDPFLFVHTCKDYIYQLYIIIL